MGSWPSRKPVVRGVEPVQIDFAAAAEPVEDTAARGPELVGENGAQILDESAGDGNRDGASANNASNDGSQDGGSGGEATTALLSQVEITDDDREDNLESATVTIDNLGEGAEVLFDTGDTGIEVKVTHVEGGGVQISFEGSADPSSYTKVLRSVSVKNDTVSQDGGSHEISVSVEDEHGVSSDPATADLEIIEDPNAVVEIDSEAATGVDGVDASADDDASKGESAGKSAKVKDLDDEEDDKSARSDKDDKSKGPKDDAVADGDSAVDSGADKETGEKDGDRTRDAKTADPDAAEAEEVAGEETGDKADDDVGGEETGAVTGDEGGDDVGDFDGSGDEEDFALYAELDGGSKSSPDWMTVSEQPAEDAVVSTGDEAAANDDWSGGDTVEVSDAAASDDLDSSIQISTLV